MFTLPDVQIRSMLNHHLSGVECLERKCQQSPRPVLATLSRSGRSRTGFASGLVAETQGPSPMVVGHCVYATIADAVDILSLVVHQHWRRSGIARQMIQRLQASSEGKPIFMAVAETNLPGQCFLRSCGFRFKVILDDDGQEPVYFFAWDERVENGRYAIAE